jgi:phosphatidylinositol alpha-1,6-mannosyltransferase
MHSLLITNDFPPFWAGEAQYYYNIWNNLPPGEVIVLAPKIPNCEEFDRLQRFKIYRGRCLLFPTFLGKLIKPFIYLFYTLKIVRRHKDIYLIHCGNILSTFLTGMFIYKLYKIPYFVYLFAEDLREYGRIKIIRNFFVKFLNNAKKIITVSEFTKNRFVKKGVKKELFKTIYPGIDMDKFSPMNSSRIKEVYNLKDKKVILSVGRLVRRKGFDMIIRSLPLVLKRIPNAVLIICGIGELEKKLKKLVNDYNLDKYVIFAGHVSNTGELFLYCNACDVFVLPSREYRQVDAEGFGIVFLEAGACGKPVIGGRSGGIPEAILDGETGLLVDPLDVEDIANKIIKILTDDDLARQLGKNARIRINEKFQWKFASRALESMNSILKEEKRRLHSMQA